MSLVFGCFYRKSIFTPTIPPLPPPLPLLLLLLLLPLLPLPPPPPPCIPLISSARVAGSSGPTYLPPSRSTSMGSTKISLLLQAPLYPPRTALSRSGSGIGTTSSKQKNQRHSEVRGCYHHLYLSVKLLQHFN